YDPHGGRAAGSREMLDSRVAEYGGEMLYINKSARLPFWAMEYSRDEGLRKYWDEHSPPYHKDGEGPLYRGQDASVYNRNQDTHAVENVTRWYDYWRERPGTGERVSSGGVNIVFSDSNTHYRGAENYRRSGEVDAVRLPKDGFYAHQVMWDGWVEAERPRTHVVGHWNYRPGTKKNVYVISSADRVELFVNNRSLGTGEQSSRFLYTFKNVEWQPGTVRAVGYDARGRKVTEASKTTAGEPAAVRLTARTSPKGLRADGADVALVDVEVVDAAGNRCPTALNMIDFTLEGPAEWRGGIAQGPDNHILSKTLPVENGVNHVIIRSTPRAGKIVVRAHAQGLKPAAVEIVSRPSAITDGLSRELPGEGLPAYLGRGPTPAGQSFVVSRRPVKVTATAAGANADKVSASFDDDETTEWASDGKIPNGWVKYDFGREATVGELVLKLRGWRTLSYPVRVTVGGQVVFEGNTPRSLGYVTLSFPPAKGRNLKIELTGRPSNRDAFGQIIEIPGTPDANSAAGRGDNRGTLAVIEAEFYEPPAP
ncbi:MAG TPA: DUF4982 domain-containing protein, partial [Pyrinomonadaceae bacterium]|nr:DUF4982 domain-containing protein [Pyrinomonadaceae bacterium]